MTFSTFYSVGTVAVTAGSAAVVGTGTNWVGNVKPGDYLLVKGLMERVSVVTDATHITLARAWPGASASGAGYDAMAVLDAVGYQQAVADLLEKLASGNLDAFAALTGAADKMPYFTGAGSMNVATVTAFARTLLACANQAAARSVLGIT